MDWNAFFDQAWVQIVLTGLGIIAGAAVSIAWASSNAERLGEMVGRRLPGDGIERFLEAFFVGFARGLAKTYSGATVTMTPQAPHTYRLEVKAAPLGASLSSGSAGLKSGGR